MVVLDAPRYAVSPQKTVHGLGRGIEFHVAVAAEKRICEAHMVAVVVGYDYACDVLWRYGVGGKFGNYPVVVHAGVDQQPAALGTYVCAVAAASAAETYEAQLFVARAKLWLGRVCLAVVGNLEQVGLVGFGKAAFEFHPSAHDVSCRGGISPAVFPEPVDLLSTIAAGVCLCSGVRRLCPRPHREASSPAAMR